MADNLKHEIVTGRRVVLISLMTNMDTVVGTLYIIIRLIDYMISTLY